FLDQRGLTGGDLRDRFQQQISESSQEKLDGEEKSEEGGGEEAQAECRLHEADDPDGSARGGRRLQRDATYRGNEEDLGLHQAQQPAGQEKQAHDQLRREVEARVRRQEPGLDVRDDQARQPLPQVTGYQGRRDGKGRASPAFFMGGTRSRAPLRGASRGLPPLSGAAPRAAYRGS